MCHQTQKSLGKSMLTDHQSLDRNSDAIFAPPRTPPSLQQSRVELLFCIFIFPQQFLNHICSMTSASWLCFAPLHISAIVYLISSDGHYVQGQCSSHDSLEEQKWQNEWVYMYMYIYNIYDLSLVLRVHLVEY